MDEINLTGSDWSDSTWWAEVTLGFVFRFAAVYGFGKPGKSAAAAAVTLTTQGEMCTTKTKKTFWEQFLIFPSHELIFILIH